ncbi:uncharacterized protein IL334_003053 [Kwoniella shivajii]|uniref:Uncharacterized protein n=1 Tax=Kwoniella shivajii TaxID=564305 RepID=A0ABZ1CWG3_9TREE|nr:hypothetical protein IL334_003053 [Kwoniella shivajii]
MSTIQYISEDGIQSTYTDPDTVMRRFDYSFESLNTLKTSGRFNDQDAVAHVSAASEDFRRMFGDTEIGKKFAGQLVEGACIRLESAISRASKREPTSRGSQRDYPWPESFKRKKVKSYGRELPLGAMGYHGDLESRQESQINSAPWPSGPLIPQETGIAQDSTRPPIPPPPDFGSAAYGTSPDGTSVQNQPLGYGTYNQSSEQAYAQRGYAQQAYGSAGYGGTVPPHSFGDTQSYGQSQDSNDQSRYLVPPPTFGSTPQAQTQFQAPAQTDYSYPIIRSPPPPPPNFAQSYEHSEQDDDDSQYYQPHHQRHLG